MPMDGMTLGFVARELNAALTGGRIDRITQPEKDTIILLIRAGSVNHQLLLCASPNNARCHLTQMKFSKTPISTRKTASSAPSAATFRSRLTRSSTQAGCSAIPAL